jgi:hypothetical protein
MAMRPNNPLQKHPLRSRTVCDRRVSAERVGRALVPRTFDGVTTRRMRATVVLSEACMRRKKTIGKPCAGNPHARFERGPQETEPLRGHRA